MSIPLLEVDVGVGQRQRLGNPQPGTGDQAEQRLVDDAAQARRRPKLPRSGQQVDDLLLAVDVRRLPLGQTTEDGVVGNLGARLELLQPTHEGAQQLQPTCPSVGDHCWRGCRERAQSAMTSTVIGPRWPTAWTWRAKLRKA